MAALMKLRHMPVVQRCVWNHINRNLRNISTSKKSNEAAATECKQECPPANDWVSYGFDYNDKNEDTNVHNASFFFSVTLCFVFGGFAWAYAPDVHMRDWAQREAFLELRRREKAGLKPIDPNFIDPNKIKLPSDQDLCDIEIVI